MKRKEPSLGDLNELVKQNFNEKVLGSMEMFKVLSKTQQTVLVDSLQVTPRRDPTPWAATPPMGPRPLTPRCAALTCR